MFEDRQDLMDLNEDVQRDLYETLKQMNHDDPKRKAIVDELEKHAKAQDSHLRYEMERYNNNIKNDIEEQRLIMDQQKIKNDKSRSRVEFAKGVMYVVGGFAMSFFSYNKELAVLPAKTFSKWSDNFFRMIGR